MAIFTMSNCVMSATIKEFNGLYEVHINNTVAYITTNYSLAKEFVENQF